MPICTAHALILRRHDVRETSLLLEVLTAEWGRFSGLIKGFRDQPARYGSPALPGSLNTIVFYDTPRKSVFLMSQCDLLDELTSRIHQPTALQAQARILELLHQGTAPRDPQPELFRLAVQALRTLSTARHASMATRLFELKFLKLLGLHPSIEECVGCNQPPGAHAGLSLRLGGLLCPQCAIQDRAAQPLTPGTLATLQHALRASWMQALRLQWSPRIRTEIERLLDRFVAFHVDIRLQTPLADEEPAYAET